MNKRKILGIAMILTAVFLLAATGVVVANSLRHSRGPTNLETERNYQDGYLWGPMHGFNSYADQEIDFQSLHNRMVESLAEVSGLTVEEIDERFNNSDHLFYVAMEAGVTQQDYFRIMLDIRRSYLEDLIKEGDISEEDYQWMFGHMDGFEGQPVYEGCHNFYPSEVDQSNQFNGRRK